MLLIECDCEGIDSNEIELEMRRRTIIIFAGLLLLSSGVMNPLAAQLTKDENLSRFDDRVLHFGFFLGVNTMGYRFTHYSDVMKDNPVLNNNPTLAAEADKYYNGVHSYSAVISEIKPGFSVGGVINLRMNKGIDFRFTPGMSLGSRQLVFSENITKSMESTISKQLYPNFDLNRYLTLPTAYIDFPVGFRYKGNRFGNLRPYIYGGGAFKWDLENKRVSESVVHLKRDGYYAEVAFGLDSYFPFFRFTSEFKFSYGLNNIIRHDSDLASPDPLPYFGYIFQKLNSNVFTLLFFFE